MEMSGLTKRFVMFAVLAAAMAAAVSGDLARARVAQGRHRVQRAGAPDGGRDGAGLHVRGDGAAVLAAGARSIRMRR